MTLAATNPRISYPGTGSTGPFAYPFKLNVETDLVVTKRSATGIETPLGWPTDFTVTGVGNATGGTVSITAGVLSGETISIRRKPPNTQPLSIRNQGAYFPAAIEDEFDRMAMQILALQDQLDRSISLTESYDPAAFNLRIPPGTAGQVLGWASGSQLTSMNVSSGATVLPGGGRTVTTLSGYIANNAVFNFKDFGAVGNNVADDTAAVQACLNAAGAVHIGLISQLGALCYLPEGSYKTTSTITMPPYVSVVGGGGQASIFAPSSGIDCFNFTIGGDINSVKMEDFGIVPQAPSTTNTAIKLLGTVNAGDWHTGVHFHRLRITDFQTAIRGRTMHQCRIRECWFQRINVAIDFRGSNLTNWIESNTFIYQGGCGAGVVVGIRVDGTADYNPGGVTLLFPESVHINGNLIYGFQIAVDMVLCTFASIMDNDINATLTGLQIATCNGVLNIRENYTEGGSVVALWFVGLSSVVATKINVEGNHFIGTGGGASLHGIRINQSGVNQNQTNISIVRNSFSGWTINDINVSGSGDLNIEDNHCFSGTSANNSIAITSTLSGRFIFIDKNKCTGNIFVSATGNLGQVIVGANYGAFATYARGELTIAQATTTLTQLLANLNALCPNFDTTANTGLKIKARVTPPDVNVGAWWVTAGPTGLTVNCAVAPGVGGAKFGWEMYVVQSNS